MVTLYVTSTVRGSGKTAVCAGLFRRLLDDGKKVAFLRLLPAKSQGTRQDEARSDAGFIKTVFGLAENVDKLCPAIGGIRDAFSEVSRDSDVVIVEGEDEPGQVSSELVKTLDAQVIIVDSTSRQSPSQRLISTRDFAGERLLGAILNKVPAIEAESIREQAPTTFGEAGIKVLGVLPEDRHLLTLTVGELAECIQGDILNNAEKSVELAENFMLGAMCVDSGKIYFDQKPNKAAVIRSERADMQLAALQTPTRCLVLSGEQAPQPQIMQQAEDREVPIIQAGGDVTSIVSSIEDALAGTRFNQERKMPRITEIMGQYIDFPTLYQTLGLAG